MCLQRINFIIIINSFINLILTRFTYLRFNITIFSIETIAD